MNNLGSLLLCNSKSSPSIHDLIRDGKVASTEYCSIFSQGAPGNAPGWLTCKTEVGSATGARHVQTRRMNRYVRTGFIGVVGTIHFKGEVSSRIVAIHNYPPNTDCTNRFVSSIERQFLIFRKRQIDDGVGKWNHRNGIVCQVLPARAHQY